MSPLLQRRLTGLLIEYGSELIVILSRGDDHHVGVILGGCTDQRDTADIDLLYDILMGSTGGNSSLKGVEIDDHKVYRINIKAMAVLIILLVTSASKDPAKDHRMEGLNSSSQDGGKTGAVLHLGTGKVKAGNIVIGATRGEDLHSTLPQLSQELLQPLFMVYRYKRSADRLATLC